MIESVIEGDEGVNKKYKEMTDLIFIRTEYIENTRQKNYYRLNYNNWSESYSQKIHNLQWHCKRSWLNIVVWSSTGMFYVSL